MAALKETVEDFLCAGREMVRHRKDPFVEDLRAIVGNEWVSNDPAIQVTYANDPFPLSGLRLPRAVALPASTEEIIEIIRRANREDIPFAVRGNGSSVYGQVFSEGLVLDMSRMRETSFDTANWSATIGPGVTSFELQSEAAKHGFRVNVAEPAATVIGNILCTGLFSTWSAAYGMGADHVLDMEFIDPNGKRLRLSDPDGPGTKRMAYRHGVQTGDGVCTRASVRLHPILEDEEGMIVPFEGFEDALRFTHDLAKRRIGFALAILGPHYLATFLSPDLELSQKVKRILPDDLGIQYGVFVVADTYGRKAVHQMTDHVVIDQRLFRTMALGLPRLAEGEALALIRSAEGRQRPIEMLSDPELQPFLEVVLDPSPETLVSAVEEDLRGPYLDLYRQPRFTDLVWINSFRIVSSRMGRHKHIIAFVLFLPLDADLVSTVCRRFATVAEDIGIDHDYGFLTPIDMGKRAVLEYDYYMDHTDPLEKKKIGQAMEELDPWLDGMCAGPKSDMTWLKTVFKQGSARKEAWFYRDLAGRPLGRPPASGNPG
jgi:hypothetical protein